MKTSERIQTIEDWLMLQGGYMKGRKFRVTYTGDDKFLIMFEEIAQWQLNKVRMKLFEVDWRHVKVDAKIITEEPKPNKDDRPIPKNGTPRNRKGRH